MRIFEEISDEESNLLADAEAAEELAALRPFLAALPRARDDGWTAQRQFDFIEALADTGSVSHAAQAVGMSRESAYRLRRRADARAFADAWNAAQSIATQRLADVALERAIHGEQVPIVSGGQIVGYRVRHFEQLAMFLLRVRDPHGHGALSLPSRDDLESAGSSVFYPIPRALRSLPRLLVRLLGGGAPAASESHRTM